MWFGVTGVTSILLLCIAVFSEQRSTVDDDSYVAAVVEYEVRPDVADNIRNYVQLTRQAASQGADIIVFPEMTLTRGTYAVSVPIHSLLREHPVPALEPTLFDEILVTFSNEARNNEIYVVINLQERMDCNASATGEYCPEQKTYMFNTNVVFDRTGAVIDRYRKIHLFKEFTREPALRPDLGVFTTDFGVTFGHFICFDLMFQVPAVQIVQKHNLTNVIFSTMWFSEMPYLTAVQIQESYAYTMNVNFLAAGANNVLVGSAGSGIYSGKAGALASVMPGVPTTRLLVYRVPKVPGQVTGSYPGHIPDDPSSLDSLKLIADPSLPSHSSRLLVAGSQEFTLVDKEVSCRFRVTLAERNEHTNVRYRAVVKSGSNRYARQQLALAACAVVACKTDHLRDCPYRYTGKENSTDIEDLAIEMTSYAKQHNDTLECDNIVYYPSSFRTNKFPLRADKYNYVINDGNEEIIENEINSVLKAHAHIQYQLNSPQSDLVFFGIWGRIYNKDLLFRNDHHETLMKDIQAYETLEELIYGKQVKKGI